MTNDELISQAQAWGFTCDEGENGEYKLFSSDEKNKDWYLIWDGEYWVMFSQGQAALNFFPEDAVQFLSKVRLNS